jgi:hypothetical protein
LRNRQRRRLPFGESRAARRIFDDKLAFDFLLLAVLPIPFLGTEINFPPASRKRIEQDAHDFIPLPARGTAVGHR